MDDVIYKEDEQLHIDSQLLDFEIQFYKNPTFFMVLTNYVEFIKGCEKFIRRTKDYTNYVAHLKELGFTRCQVLGSIDSSLSEKEHPLTVEMHHGPIFTLFDYCGAVIGYMTKHKMKITTPRVAKIIMDEHWNGNIQTVMLSSTVHQAVDSGRLFISLKQAVGNLNNFLKRYADGITSYQREKINKYIEMSEKYKATDNGLFDLKETMHDWSTRRRL